MNLIDEIGKTYGKLTVIERAENTPGGQAQWLCKCSCGNEVVVRGICFRRKQQTRSCGCLRSDNSLPNGVAARRKLQYGYKRHARLRGYEWKLTPEQFQQLTSSPCHYCGIEPKQAYHPEGNTGVYVYNGLDRVDNSLGYTLDNIVPCCGICNKAKTDMDYHDFLRWIKNIFIHRLAWQGISNV